MKGFCGQLLLLLLLSMSSAADLPCLALPFQKVHLAALDLPEDIAQRLRVLV